MFGAPRALHPSPSQAQPARFAPTPRTTHPGHACPWSAPERGAARAPARRYAVSKTALLGLTKALAEELGPDGIRVNCVAPGIVPTKVRRCCVHSVL